MATKQNQTDRTTLVWAGVASLIAWSVPLLNLLTLPLEFFNTHVHELFHALAAVGTGGRVDHILVYSDASGVTPVYGGILSVVATAGYVGASLAGALLILASSKPVTARNALKVAAVALGFSTLIWVRGSAVGVTAGLFWIAILWAMASRLNDRWVLFAVAFLGLQQCLRSAQSLLVLVDISVGSRSHTDALLMQQATLVPAAVWAVIWTGFSFVLMALALRAAWKPAL